MSYDVSLCFMERWIGSITLNVEYNYALAISYFRIGVSCGIIK